VATKKTVSIEVLAKLFHKGVFGKKISFMDVFSYVKVVLREKTRA
jgi:hypothetical protein